MKCAAMVAGLVDGRLVPCGLAVPDVEDRTVWLPDDMPEAARCEIALRFDEPDGVTSCGLFVWSWVHQRHALAAQLVNPSVRTVETINRDRERAVRLINERAEELLARLPQARVDMRSNDLLDRAFFS